jgi:hypothetical protein
MPRRAAARSDRPDPDRPFPADGDERQSLNAYQAEVYEAG